VLNLPDEFRLQEIDDLTMTPFEKNLEFWRQLWRVIEKRSVFTPLRVDALQPVSSSDVIVQIVDARNPLLFRCEDLESYVREMSPDGRKVNVILVNKADLLTDEQR
jgi:large subunit GTPase 1